MLLVGHMISLFTDIASDKWYVSAIQYAYDTGLMSGVGEGFFAPESTLTREQFAQMLYSQAGKPVVTGTSNFADVQDSFQWYYSAVLWANQNGIVNGIYTTSTAGVWDSYPDNGDVNYIKPLDTATRAECAAMMRKMLTM